MWKKEDGNMILEAAIVAPVFMLFIFFLWILIMVSAAQMKLDRATKDAVEGACKAGYIIGYVGSAGDKMKDKLEEKVEEVADDKMVTKNDSGNFIYSMFKDAVKNILGTIDLNEASYGAAYGTGGLIFGQNQLKSAIAKDLTESMGGDWAEKVVVEYTEESNEFVAIKVTCEVPINIPLVKDYKMKLSCNAKSYIWKMEY